MITYRIKFLNERDAELKTLDNLNPLEVFMIGKILDKHKEKYKITSPDIPGKVITLQDMGLLALARAVDGDGTIIV